MVRRIKPGAVRVAAVGVCFSAALAGAPAAAQHAAAGWVPTVAAEPVPPEDKLAPALRDALAAAGPRDSIPVIVILDRQVDVAALAAGGGQPDRRVVSRLRSLSAATQPGLRDMLARRRREGTAASITPLWIVNGLAVRARPSVIRQLASRPEVAAVELDAKVPGPAALDATRQATAAEPNLDTVNAPDLWALGYRGEGVVVANMDSGVDGTHPDLAAQWRGGTNSWYDPYGQHPSTPVDVSGHGTMTMGIMVGDDASGTAVGMAPDARWIAVKMFNDQGFASLSAIHMSFQWLLDPDRNPATDDAPDVVNGSWTFSSPGCFLTFRPDVQALRAAGVLPVFSAGNSGPGPGTSHSPANYAESFAVGATDNTDVVAGTSSRGPDACGGTSVTFPDIVAPGVNIRTTDTSGLYASGTGTSFAAPHVVGALALLLDVFGSLTPDEQDAALRAGAVDLGTPGPDNAFGSGRLDVLRAYQSLHVDPPPPPAPPSWQLSLVENGSVGGLAFADEDILSYDGSAFALHVDGSDVGLGGPAVDVDAVERLPDGGILLSFASALTLGALGSVDDSDVVRFDATSLGATTSGSFSWYLDGSDVGLTSSSENVDALDVLPDGRVLISANGTASVTGVSGNDEDLLVLAPSQLGATTAGTWAMYFDGSDVGLTATGEDVDALDAGADGRLYLSTSGDLSVGTPAVTGGDEDVVVCIPVALGPTTACTWEPTHAFSGMSAGLAASNDVDAIAPG